ncbi:hypothetical protein KP509_1Z124500 [Ceratopteris richardii]|nr:hypothetical protein KP509_1Z124500 [Ceratopteris richardii]
MSSLTGGTSKSSSTAVIASIVVAVTVLSVILVAFYIFWSRADVSKARRRLRGKDAEDWVVPQGVKRFTYKEVLEATKSFDESCQIGRGGFGEMYFGMLEDGRRVAIKRAGEFNHRGMSQFRNEITLLSRLHHRHLVKLEGFCDDKDEQVLGKYFLRGHLSTASDVYGYGVVLLELITGQLSIDHKRPEDYNLVAWFKPRVVKQGIQAVIDPRLGLNFPVEAYEEVAEIAMNCTTSERGDRPTMQFIASKLEQILSGLIPPPEHFQPVSSTFEGKAPSMEVSPATSRRGVTGEPLLTDIKLESAFNGT